MATATVRRIGVESSRTRAMLLEAAERLMRNEGYAAVTSRRVAAEAGLKPQLVHYYFLTMDDLFLALFERVAERNTEAHERALQSDTPLQALWALMSDPSSTGFVMEFAALANHRKAIRAEIARYAEEYRTKLVQAIERVFSERGMALGDADPLSFAMMLTATAQIMVQEIALEYTQGHAETRALIERRLHELESRPKIAAAKQARRKR